MLDAIPPAVVLVVISLLSTALGLVLFLKTPVLRVMNRFMLTVGQSVNALSDFHLDEDERIRLSRRLSGRILGGLGLLLVLLAGVVAIAAAPFLLVDFSLYTTGEILLYIGGGIGVASAVYFLWFHTPDTREYSEGKQLFHYLTLGAPGAGKVNLRLSELLGGRPAPPERGIIVTGLARAGTTTLLTHLSHHPSLQSITYRHMPFLLGGRLWRRLNAGSSQAAERSHQDGILVSLDSPEAFDEYYWRIILREGYYRKAGLLRHSLTPEQVATFERYIAAQLKPGKLYLSKNNNFILRAASFLEHRPNYVVALVFREPLAHAKSLLRQQQLQTAHQDEEPFVLDYMNWLGHNEFGKGRLDFRLTGEKMIHKDMETLDYWLERWIEYYTYALGLTHPSVVFVSNTTIATAPAEATARVLARAGLSPLETELPTRTPKPASATGYDEGLLQRANALYESLLAREAETQAVR